MTTPDWINWCPHGRSLIGAAKDSSHVVILPVRCKRWSCTFCRMVNEILLKERVLQGHPNRFLTLTVSSRTALSPAAISRTTRPKISRLFQTLRRKIGTLEAAVFVELHKSGYPHWHALLRSPYIPHQIVRQTWKNLTGSHVIDIRLIKDQAVAARYVTKYVCKQLDRHRLAKIGHLFSFTRNYNTTEKNEKDQDHVWSYDRNHPQEVIERLYHDWKANYDGRVCTLTAPPHKPPSLAFAEATSPKQPTAFTSPCP